MAGTFPIRYSTKMPSGRAFGEAVDVDLRTGQRQIGTAVASLAAPVSALALDIARTHQNLEFTTFKRKEEEARDAAISGLNAPDFDIFDDDAVAKLKTAADTDRSGLKSRSRRVNENYELYLESISAGWDKAFGAKVREIKSKNLQDDLRLNGDSLLAKGYLVEYAKLYGQARATNLISQREFETRMANAPNDSILQKMRVAAVNNPQTVPGLFEQLEDPTPDQLIYGNNIKVNAENAIENQDDETGEEFLGLLANKLDPTKEQLTFDMIGNSKLSFGGKKEWFTTLRVFDNYSEGELKEAFTDKGEVLADIYHKIDNDTLTNELDTMIGKGLSPVKAHQLKKEIRKPYERDTEQLFKRIFGWRPELGFESPLSGFMYEKVLREWETEIKRQDATGEKIVEIGRSVARPYFIRHLETTLKGQAENIPEMIELALGEEIRVIPEVEEPEEDLTELSDEELLKKIKGE